MEEMHCHIIHMDMLHLALLPTLAISLPGKKYRLAAHTTATETAETMPGANYVTDDIHIYENMNSLAIIYNFYEPALVMQLG